MQRLRAEHEIDEGRALGDVTTLRDPVVMAELEQLKDLRIVPAKPDFADEISDKQIRAAVKIPEDFEAKLAAGESSTGEPFI